VVWPRGGCRFEAGDLVDLATTEAGQDPIPAAFRARPEADEDPPGRAASSGG